MHGRLADDNVKSLLFKLSLPAVTGMFVMALYNIVDTIFVGRWVGTMAIAGLSVVFPIQMVVLSVGLLFGIGGGSVISRNLGAGNTEEAEKAFGTVAFCAVAAGLILTVAGLVFKRKYSAFSALLRKSCHTLPITTVSLSLLLPFSYAP